ncbi:hypothetical protein ACWD7C_19530 [Streptomyces sp. NPDC005134]|uniref:hypothetical protein n=1 Tax=Streptomyces sp. NPDC005098 TaxID=3154560 RepID=UPI0033BC7BC6
MTAEPSMPSPCNRRPAVPVIHRIAAGLCSFPYRITRSLDPPHGIPVIRLL